MKIAICEISASSHVTYVVSISKIFASNPENEVHVVIKAASLSDLGEISNIDNIVIHPIVNRNEGLDSMRNLNEQDIHQWIFPTLEPTSRGNIELIQEIFHLKLQGAMSFAVHNVDLWFSRSKINNALSIAFSRGKLIEKYVKIKSIYYSRFAKKIQRKIDETGGAFIVISENIKNELALFARRSRIVVIPFCVFDEKYYLSKSNSRKGPLYVVIPGYVSNSRRDYIGFLRSLKSTLDKNLRSQLTVDLLGGINDGENGVLVLRLVEELNQNGFDIRIHKEAFIPMNAYDSILANCDVILGILNVRQSGLSVYGKTKETGITYNMIKMAKPGFLPLNYQAPVELNTSIVGFANNTELIRMLEKLVRDKDLLMELQTKALQNSRVFEPSTILEKISGNN